MFSIVQISDLHFGREDQDVAKAGEAIIKKLKPDLIVIAGDLTQRNRSKECFLALEFLRRINRPILIVPGNHDIPFFNIYARFRKPLSHYDRYFNSMYVSVFENDFLNIIGLNTTSRFQVKDGKLRSNDMEMVIESFDKTKQSKWNILVTHHPFSRIRKNHHPILMDKFLASIDVWLSGHLHRFKLENLQYRGETYDGLQCISGTFISTRLRSEENSFNVLEFENNTTATITNFYFNAGQQKFIKSTQYKINK